MSEDHSQDGESGSSPNQGSATLSIPIHQVDAFVDPTAARGGVFTGNPAAVCLLEAWLPDSILQAIAAENNLSETAFVVPSAVDRAVSAGGSTPTYELRWFTPTIEVDLCGHATLASGYVVLEHVLAAADSVAFLTRSGELRVCNEADGVLAMSLPLDRRSPCDPAAGLADVITVPGVASGANAVVEWLGGTTWIAVLEAASDVGDAVIDTVALSTQKVPYLVITAPGEPESGVDFVSRFFAPGAGIDEDPVTGSAHCALAPYWSDRLDRTRLTARQMSRRGGFLDCEIERDIVRLRGSCAPYLRGTITY